ncbi:alpha/beta hydrolase [Leptospira kirschneri]|uniref:alpha/beta hydrolase n=1 Tax=Leptospira kirschneri TaxID=29507 RepID=UPI00398ADC1E
MYKFLKYSCILFLLLEVFGCFVSRKLIFIAQGKDTLPSYSGTLLQIQNEDRIVYAYFTRNSSRLAVVFHGQHGTLQSMSYLGAKLSQMGFSVLLVEYPGYGKAKRYSSSESNIYSDADAAINFVQKNFSFSKQNTIAIGYSLGTGVAVEMARKNLVSKMILFAPYTSIPDVASYRYVPILPQILIWDRFNSISKSKDLILPALIVHGKKDVAVPYYMGEALSKSFSNAKLITLSNANHSLFGSITETHWKLIRDFIQ